ncbi:MAG: hypothetical protein KF730_04355 [Sphingomonas sp.]|uniref:hypothetical protein n=1 Tax=Sphingomonas sp. TaxID=28214 RepID=UPI0025F4C38A|nr:hypothetical protein [Sphingomonas sp.]MBX3563792.1 hypothetical protein [Sphingomonas sp.]
MVKRNRIILALGALALLLLSLGNARHAAISIAMARADDPSPRKMEAAVDLGVIAVSVLVTWSKRLGY